MSTPPSRPSTDLRSAILRRLATPQEDNRVGQSYLPSALSRTTGRPLHEVSEALWGLVGDGLIYPDPFGQGGYWADNAEWRLTTLGLRAATNQSWEPRDPSRYLARLRSSSTEISPGALTYVSEALAAFNAGCYLATSVMLGVAAEHVFNRLASAFVATSTDGAKLQRLLEDPRATHYQRFSELRKRLEPQRAALPDGLADNLTLDAVADLLRVARNDAGHPTGQDIDEDLAYTHLQLAGGFLARMTALAVHFEAQAPAAPA